MDLSLLHNYIAFDILSRLPPKLLVQSRTVSKRWHSLISDPEFTRFQFTRANHLSISGFFFQGKFEFCDEDVETLSYIPLEPRIYENVLAFLPEKVIILDTSNGLVCCRSRLPSSNPVIYICNPVNKEFTTLKLDNLNNRDYITFISDNPSSESFGYKLVRVSTFIHSDEEFYFTFEIYDSKRSKWVKSKEVCYSEDSLCCNNRVFCNGDQNGNILYWLTLGLQVLMFDVEKELSCLISLPHAPTHENPAQICLGEANNKLHCVMVSKGALRVYALVDCFTSEWSVITSVPLQVMVEENPEFCFKLVENVASTCADKVPWMHPLAFKDEVLFMRVSNSAYSFHVGSREMRWLCDIGSLDPKSLVCPRVVPYSMSLAPVPHP